MLPCGWRWGAVGDPLPDCLKMEAWASQEWRKTGNAGVIRLSSSFSLFECSSPEASN